MRKFIHPVLLVCILACVASPAFAQKEKEKSEEEFLIQKDAETGAYQYSEVFTYDSTKMSQADAYKAAKRYILSTLKTADNNTLTDDPSNSEIISTGALGLGKHKLASVPMAVAAVEFKVKVYFKPGRYKVTIDNLVYQGSSAGGQLQYVEFYNILRETRPKQKADARASIDNALVSFVSGLRRAVEKKDADKDAW